MADPRLGAEWTARPAAGPGPLGDSGGAADPDLQSAADALTERFHREMKVVHEDEDDAEPPSDDDESSSTTESEGDVGENPAEEEAEPEPLAEWACAYCGVQNPSCVVKCVKTGKWFCNGRQQGSSASCAIFHLVKSKCKEVQLHADSALGDTVLECYVTGNRNVFSLGFVPLRSDNTVVVLSRTVQPGAPELRHLDVDLGLWEAIIADRQFVPWLVQVPQGEDLERARVIGQRQMALLEEAWSQNPNAGLGDVGEKAAAEGPERVALRYQDAYHYQNIYGPLLRLEADFDRQIAEGQRKEGIEVTWEGEQWGPLAPPPPAPCGPPPGPAAASPPNPPPHQDRPIHPPATDRRCPAALGSKLIAVFQFPIEDADIKLGVGDEVILRHPSRPGWEGKGKVVCMDPFGRVEAVLPASRDIPSHFSSMFTVERVWNDTSFQRMQSALTRFAVNEASVSGYIYLKILGHDVPEKPIRAEVPEQINAPGLPRLNQSQGDAVRAVLRQPLALIQGPPGTGKTVTSATIVYHLATQGRAERGGGQVLVTAPSNVAVDHLAEKIAQTGLRVVRLCARAREDTEVVSASAVSLTLHHQVRNADVPEAFRLRTLLKLKEDTSVLTERDAREMVKLRGKLEAEALNAAEVICCTCSGAGDPRMQGARAGRATPPLPLPERPRPPTRRQHPTARPPPPQVASSARCWWTRPRRRANPSA